MALTLGDVLNVLSDPVVGQMNFWVGPVHVSGRRFEVVRDHIRAGNIEVVEGTNPDNAFYDNQTDILITQNVASPPSLDAKALLLHECWHAVFDVFANGSAATRHLDELGGYLVQHAYLMRSKPSWGVAPNNGPWFNFFTAMAALVKARNLDQNIGNGTRFTLNDLEPLRVKLAALPGVNYGTFAKTASSGANSLTRLNPFLSTTDEPVSMSSRSVSHESYPDPGDEYLIRTLGVRYQSTNVGGFGGRLRELRRDFAHCSKARAVALLARLSTRKRGDRVSELFHDILSTEGRAILLRVLRMRRNE